MIHDVHSYLLEGLSEMRYRHWQSYKKGPAYLDHFLSGLEVNRILRGDEAKSACTCLKGFPWVNFGHKTFAGDLPERLRADPPITLVTAVSAKMLSKTSRGTRHVRPLLWSSIPSR